jgi:hypothetical protein
MHVIVDLYFGLSGLRLLAHFTLLVPWS